jgi:hypothetical protein
LFEQHQFELNIPGLTLSLNFLYVLFHSKGILFGMKQLFVWATSIRTQHSWVDDSTLSRSLEDRETRLLPLPTPNDENDSNESGNSEKDEESDKRHLQR